MESADRASSERPAIDINKASVLELAGLPTVGLARAYKIVGYRTEHGPFSSLSQLKQVDPRIDPQRLRGLAEIQKERLKGIKKALEGLRDWMPIFMQMFSLLLAGYVLYRVQLATVEIKRTQLELQELEFGIVPERFGPAANIRLVNLDVNRVVRIEDFDDLSRPSFEVEVKNTGSAVAIDELWFSIFVVGLEERPIEIANVVYSEQLLFPGELLRGDLTKEIIEAICHIDPDRVPHSNEGLQELRIEVEIRASGLGTDYLIGGLSRCFATVVFDPAVLQASQEAIESYASKPFVIYSNIGGQ